MLRFLVIGAWTCLVTGGATWGMTRWRLQEPALAPPPHPVMDVLRYEKTPLVWVPIISSGAVQGYMGIRLIYTAQAAALQAAKLPPLPYVIDEMLREAYEKADASFSQIEKKDLAAMLRVIKGRVNQRLGSDLIQDVLVEEFTYQVAAATQR